VSTTRLAQALSDRYRIERELGQGGMATVYLARDLKHDREVALKVLRPELAAVIGAERFLSEIRITARLDHPHILTLIDSGEADGMLFYVLPFVRGESLRTRLVREKQLGVDEALAITKQIAGALEYAHQHGVVHRDIKPENILIHEGEAVLTDFGIALAVKEAGGNRLTETGLSLGTPQYMSPEQATGDRELDARSDVYSLAAVLYEMLAGEPPHTGATVQAVIAKLMTERPTRLRTVRDTVPEGVDNAVAKALAKVPADRYAGAAAFTAALTTANQAPPTPARRAPPIYWMGGAGVLVVAGWFLMRDRGGARAPSPFAAAVPVQLTTSGEAFEPLMSPDGSLVAYVERRCESERVCRGDLVVREVSGEGVSTIYSEPGLAASPVAWSADSRYIVVSIWALESNRGLGTVVLPQRGGTLRRLVPESFVTGGFVAADTIVLAPFEGESHWLRRIVVSTGEVVDSVLLPVGTYLDRLEPSGDGSRLLASHYRAADDEGQVAVLDRTGAVLDTLRGDAIARWTGRPGELILNRWAGDGGRQFIRRRLDARGRFLPESDTLRAVPEDGIIGGISPDGTALVYGADRLGETGIWTAVRPGPSGPFSRGRRIGTSTGRFLARISPGGRWLMVSERIETPAGIRTRLTVEPFEGGARQVVDPSAAANDFAFSPADDSVAVFTGSAAGQYELTVYPLPSGRSVRRGTFRGLISDAEWLSDGRLTMVGADRQSIRVFERDGSVTEVPVPASVGVIDQTGRSPAIAALAVGSHINSGDQEESLLHWLDLRTGVFTLITRSTNRRMQGGLWWTSDGWVHVPVWDPRDRAPRLYRAPVSGGEPLEEPPITFETDGRVTSLAHDGRRAIVEAQRSTSDVWVLRAAGSR
jgi:tRNA A-37 threonylcarbamoyl transferase component Bud32